MKRFLALITSAYSAACAAMPVERDREPSIHSECAGTWAATQECALAFEGGLLASNPQLFSRNGDELTLIPTSEGVDPHVLRNPWHQYRVVSYYPQYDISVIEIHGHEYYDAYAYHHPHGTFFQIFDKLEFSPSGKILAAYNCDLESGFGPNAIAVYQLDPFVKLSTQFNLTSFCVSGLTFESESSIALETKHDQYRPQFARFRSSSCKLVEESNVWQFNDPSCFKIDAVHVPWP